MMKGRPGPRHDRRAQPAWHGAQESWETSAAVIVAVQARRHHATMNDETKNASPSPAGPLRGLRVVEFAGLGPVSFTAMLLADMGARVVRIERPGAVAMERGATMRGRERLALDLRSADGLATTRELLRHAEVAIEGFRPGVMERLGLGPAELFALRPALVFGRMTGWGRRVRAPGRRAMTSTTSRSRARCIPSVPPRARACRSTWSATMAAARST